MLRRKSASEARICLAVAAASPGTTSDGPYKMPKTPAKLPMRYSPPAILATRRGDAPTIRSALTAVLICVSLSDRPPHSPRAHRPVVRDEVPWRRCNACARPTQSDFDRSALINRDYALPLLGLGALGAGEGSLMRAVVKGSSLASIASEE
jgi:hypothetical protein